MATKTVSNSSPPAKPMAFPGASHPPVKQLKPPKAEKPQMPLYRGSCQGLAKQPKENLLESAPSCCPDLLSLPPGQRAPGPQAPSLIPKATDTCLSEDHPAKLQPMGQPPGSSKNLHPDNSPPAKPPSAAAKKPKGKKQHQNEKKQHEKMLGFSLTLVLSRPKHSARNTTERLAIPEATEVTLPLRPPSPCAQ